MMKAFVMAVCLVAVSARADAASITIAWDPNPEPSVVGYLVYVGTAPGHYSLMFDVGGETTFALPSTVSGTRYYFTVAAYTHATIGAKAAEVSAVAVESPVSKVKALETPSAATACTTAGSCYRIRTLDRTASPRTALAAAGDGRVFLIDDRRRVLVMAGDAVLPAPALVIDDPSIALDGLAVDPQFARTHLVFVSEITTRADGRRGLTIARYREVANRLGERAVIVSDLPLPSQGHAPVAVDAAGLLYVAMPASADRDPYGASLLRFAPDGTTPRDNRAFSPIYAAGLDHPATLVASPAGSTWLASVDDSGRALLAATRVPGDTAPDPVLVTAAGANLFRVTIASGTVDRLALDAVAPGELTSVAAGPGGRIYAGVALSANPADGFALLVLEPVVLAH